MAFDQDEVTTSLERDTVRATGVVDAPPEAVFDYLRRPANHPEISGDHSVRGVATGPEVLGAGDEFGIKMHIGAPYRVRNKVVEFEPDRKIAWCNFGRQRWRWEVEPAGEGKWRVGRHGGRLVGAGCLGPAPPGRFAGDHDHFGRGFCPHTTKSAPNPEGTTDGPACSLRRQPPGQGCDHR